MKTKLLFICALVTFFSFTELSAQKKKNQETVKFLVEEMECNNCKAKVEKNIAFEKGVKDLKCDVKNRTVTITYDSKKTTPEKLVDGFKKIKMSAVEVNDETEKSEPTKIKE